MSTNKAMQASEAKNENKEEILVNSQWLKVIRENLHLPNGKIIEDFYSVERPAYSAIVPILANQDILLVKQYRHGPRKEILNIPMGVLNKEEKPLAAAHRELREEIGYQAKKMTLIGTFENAPSFLRLECHLFLAQELQEEHSVATDLDEQVTIVRLSLAKATDMVFSGEIHDMTSVIGILAVKKLLQEA